MIKTYRIVIILLVQTLVVKSQHYQFSQFYAAPTYLNPAFTGAHVCSRLTMNYRSQWSGIPGGFTTYQASFDHYFRKIKSGLGVQLFNDRAGPGGLQTSQVSGLYAYETRLNKTMMLRAGFSAGSVQRTANYNAYIFGDQLENGESGTTAEQLAIEGTRYFDVGSGILIYSKSWWAGLSSSHMNRPNQSLLNNMSPLPPETKLHAGYKYVIESFEGSKGKTGEHYATLAINYKKQAKFNQVDVGVYYNKNLFVAGIWYRGIPLLKRKIAYENNDAVVFLFGLAIQRFKIGYSYDLTVSTLTNARSKGANELSVTYQFCQGKIKGRRKRNMLISCPKF